MVFSNPRNRFGMLVGPAACTVLVLIAVAATADEWPATPPRPNPESPVDYVAWMAGAFLPPQGANAANYYAQAAQSLAAFENDQPFDVAAAGPWIDQSEVEQWLAANAEPLTNLRQGARSDFFHQLLQPTADATVPPDWKPALHLAVLRGLGALEIGAQGLLAYGWRAWSQGDEAVIIEEALTCIAIGRQLEKATPMIARYVSLALRERGYRAILTAARLSSDADALASSLVVRLSDADQPLLPLDMPYRFEHLTTWDLLQRTYQPTDQPGEWSVPISVAAVYADFAEMVGVDPQAWQDTHRQLMQIGFDQSLSEIDAYFKELLAWNDQPYHQAAQGIDDMNNMAAELGNRLLRRFVAQSTMARRRQIHVAGIQRGAHLTLRILRHRARNGRYPDKLDDLSNAAFMKPWRTDPYTGRDLIYERTRDNFVLYSVGVDAKDDAGRPYISKTLKGDLTLWPIVN